MVERVALLCGAMEPVKHGITVAAVARFADIATDALSAAREEVDALNVYPVPDGDTGTNMFLTVSAARDELRAAVLRDPELEMAEAMKILSRAALLGARGNSGVILSQMLRAFLAHLATTALTERNATVMAQAMVAATDASYAAVGEPVEGTILTVARAASDAALVVADEPRSRARDVFAAAALAARQALARTPEQLEVSVVINTEKLERLDAVEQTSTGRRPDPADPARTVRQIPIALLGDDLTEDGPAYEVMYLLDAQDEAIMGLRAALAGLGDSLVVVGGDGLWNVHVHVDDVGAAVEAGINAGRPHRIRVTHFAEQIGLGKGGSRRESTRSGRKVVVVAAGPGLTQLFESTGAVVVSGGPGQRPSAGELLTAITSCGAAEVVLLPNDGDTVRAAEIAAHTAQQEQDIRVEVIPTLAQVQGLAAVAVHEPGRAFEADVREMTATARHVRHGAVTVAARQAITMAGPCEPGDALGVIAGDFAVVGSDLNVVALDIIDRLLAGGGELVTIVSGEHGEALAAHAAAEVEAKHPHVDVVVYEGGQERYPLLVSVE